MSGKGLLLKKKKWEGPIHRHIIAAKTNFSCYKLFTNPGCDKQVQSTNTNNVLKVKVCWDGANENNEISYFFFLVG